MNECRRPRLDWLQTAAAISVCMAVLWSAVAPALSWANPLNEMQEELLEIQQKKDEAAKQLTQTRTQERSVTAELNALERELQQAEDELAALNNQLQRTENELNQTAAELKRTEEELTEQTELLGERLRAMQENGTVSYIEVLLTSGDFSELLTRLDLMQEIVAQDVALMEAIKIKQAEVEAKKKELEEKKVQLLAVQNSVRAKRESIEVASRSKKRLLTDIHQEKSVYEKALNELERTSRELEQAIRRLQSPDDPAIVTKGQGAMAWPTAGPITSYYGYRTHPIHGTRKLHTGLDIGAPHGQTVVAAADGTVIMSDWYGGYGQTIVIDHGGGVSTLYGHNSSLVVGVGQQVVRGQTIAKIGSTGVSTGPHCHFEVRVNGTPEDPLGWL